MSNIIPFSESALPAHLRKDSNETLADDLIVSGGGFPVMSIKGKVFTIKRGDEDTILMRQDDDETPASGIEVVLLRAQKAVTKTFYSTGYTEGADAKPTCYSNDGIAPAADAEDPQCNKCAICPHNQWGSRITDNGKEAKACQDNKRIAIAAPGAINDPMLLRIPPGSFKALTEYAKLLKTRGLDYNMVLTRVSFEAAAAVPQLKFKPMGFLDAATYEKVKAEFNSDLVQDIIGITGAPVPPVAEDTPAGDADGSEAARKAKQDAIAKAKAEDAKAKAEEAKAEEAKAPAKQRAPAKKRAPAKTTEAPKRELKLTQAAIDEGYTLKGFKGDEWHDDDIVAEGWAEWVEVEAKAPPKKRAPAKKAPAKKEPEAEPEVAETKQADPLVDVPVDDALADALAELDDLNFDD